MTQKTKLIITAAQYERMQIPGTSERRDIPGTSYINWPDAGIFVTHFGEEVLIEFDPGGFADDATYRHCVECRLIEWEA